MLNNGISKNNIFLLNAPNQLTKFRTKTQVEINDDARGTYNKYIQFKFKTLMLNSSLCDIVMHMYF